jgi:hypothetical protein
MGIRTVWCNSMRQYRHWLCATEFMKSHINALNFYYEILKPICAEFITNLSHMKQPTA